MSTRMHDGESIVARVEIGDQAGGAFFLPKTTWNPKITQVYDITRISVYLLHQLIHTTISCYSVA